MNDNKISSIKSSKDLGINIASKLNWSSHIERVVKNCNSGFDCDTVGLKAPEKINGWQLAKMKKSIPDMSLS